MRGVLAPEVQEIIRGTIQGPDPGKIWISTDGIPPWVRKYASAENPKSVTIIYSIWFKPDHYNWRNLFHEIKHCEQFYIYREDFIDVYSKAVMLSGYEDSKFEQQAQDYADKMIERVKK